MGRKIDQITLLLLPSAVIYAFFARLTGDPFATAVLTFAVCATLFHVFRHNRRPAKMSVRQARAILLDFACMSDEDAKSEIRRLTRARKSDVILPRHPTFSVSSGDVFSAWKQHRGEKTVRMISTCYADGRAKAFAKTLQEPVIEIMDAARLIPIIRRSDLDAPKISFSKETFQKLRLLIAALPERHSWPKHLMFGVLFMPVYLLSGNTAYLFLSLVSLFLAGVSLRTRHFS